MKPILFVATLSVCLAGIATADLSPEIKSEMQEFVELKYPNDTRMQQFTYKQQLVAYKYLEKAKDADAKDFAERAYPEDYAMQKFTYDQQAAAKRYIQSIDDEELKTFSMRAYP